MNTRKIRAWAKGFCAKVLILLLVGLMIPMPAFAAPNDQWAIGKDDAIRINSAGNIILTPASTITITGTMSLVGAFSPSSITVSGNIVGNGNWTVGSDASDTVTWNAYIPATSSLKFGTTAAGGTIGWSSGNARIENTGNSYITGTFGTSGLSTLASAAVTGAANLNGNVGLGDASADSITCNGYFNLLNLGTAAAGAVVSYRSTQDDVNSTKGLNVIGPITASTAITGASGAYTNTVTAGAFTTTGVVTATGQVTGGTLSTPGNVLADGAVIGDEASFANAVGAGSFVATGNVKGAGGFLQTYAFYKGAAWSGMVNALADAVGTPSGSLLPYHIPTAGSAMRIAVAGSAVCAAGSADFEITINGAGTGLFCTISATGTTQYARATQAMGLDVLAPGDRLGVRITSNAAFTESNNYIIVGTVESGNN